MSTVPYKKSRWQTALDWFQLLILVSAIGSCTYWLDQDDKRMKTTYVANCEASKVAGTTKAGINCEAAFWTAYKETFGR